MKVVILCGGFGTRLSEETQVKPKPMISIGGQPILWHIMNYYEHFGFDDFTLALGYKGHYIKEYFLNYYSLSNDFRVNLQNGDIEHFHKHAKKWKIDLIDTGPNSMTGGRLRRLAPQLKDHGTFMLTYGDGLANVDINKLLAFHRSHGKIATVTAVRPPARFGAMIFDKDQVTDFKEKPQTGEGWINGGYFIFEPEIFNYLESDDTILETTPLENLANDGQLMGYKHDGFWHCMDTLRDRNTLEQLWQANTAPWKV